jgi:hypothetical protein
MIVNSELEKFERKQALAQFKIPFRHLSDRLEETT